VYATCRSSSNELEALGVARVVTGVDVTSADAADKLVAALAGVAIDSLINNGRLIGSKPWGLGFRVKVQGSTLIV
jgi:predicted secreted protein